jgi:hypothetical protein
MLLADDFSKGLGTPLAIENLRGHDVTIILHVPRGLKEKVCASLTSF